MTREKLTEITALFGRQFKTQDERTQVYGQIAAALGVNLAHVREVRNATDLRNVLKYEYEKAMHKMRAEESAALAQQKGIAVGVSVRVDTFEGYVYGTATRIRKDGMVQVKLNNGASKSFMPERVEVWK